MKKYFWILFLAFGCASHKYGYDVIRKVPGQKLTPFGTLWLRDNLVTDEINTGHAVRTLFIDETEVTNFAYQEFLFFLKRRDTAKYTRMLPDTTCWTRADVGFALTDPLVTLYWKHPAYRDYPVVGVSHEQAVEFCKWRTDMVNVYYYTHRNKIKYKEDSLSVYLKKAPVRVKYRLPAKEEWEYAAAAGLDYAMYPLGYESLTDHKLLPANNTLEYYTLYTKTFSQYDKGEGLADQSSVEPTVPVYYGKPNRYGLYQMLGNVSELVADSMVKGLNFSLPIYSLSREETETGSYLINTKTYNYKLTEKYIQPEPWIGFRCVCEVFDN
jgi:formylglycine-generating enzyme required for sulfatase activity